jgi:hypothetical protein
MSFGYAHNLENLCSTISTPSESESLSLLEEELDAMESPRRKCKTWNQNDVSEKFSQKLHFSDGVNIVVLIADKFNNNIHRTLSLIFALALNYHKI